SEDLSGEVWVKLEAAAGAMLQIARQDGRFDLRLDANGVPEIGVYSNNSWTYLSGQTALQPGVWTHLGFSFDEPSIEGQLIPISGPLRLYVDGVEEAFGFPAIPLGTSTSPIKVGPAGTSGSTGLVMTLDQFALSDVARPAEHFLAAAYRPIPQPAFSGSLPQLPSGLDPAAAEVPSANPWSPSVDALGQVLFFDKGLSISKTTSCATCHVPALDYTDGLALGVGHNGAMLPRGTPSLINRLFSSDQFWDSRADSLEEQAFQPIIDPDEMGHPNVASVLAYLTADPNGLGYSTLFTNAFGSATPTRDGVEKGLATFMRNIVRGSSAEDQYRTGAFDALSDEQILGRELFFGKARCSACHHGTNFTDELLWHTGTAVDADPGAFSVTGLDRHLGAFKTPSLRNVANTEPYFHDGSAHDLFEVLDFYDAGGQRSDGQELGGASKAPDANRPLGLTPAEKGALVSYLKALTGTKLPSNH
ncbi:MAG: cytochrome c peroxidase, partial [Planctomycetota bacterium]